MRDSSRALVCSGCRLIGEPVALVAFGRFDLPATVLLREIRARGYEGGITILRELVATIKARHVKRLVDRFETEPGRQAQVDFGSCGTIWHRGRRRRLSLVAVVLGHSRVI